MTLYRSESDRGLWKKYRHVSSSQPQHFHKPHYLDMSKPVVTYSRLNLGESYQSYNTRQSNPNIRGDLRQFNSWLSQDSSERNNNPQDSSGRGNKRSWASTKSCPATPRASSPQRTKKELKRIWIEQVNNIAGSAKSEAANPPNCGNLAGYQNGHHHQLANSINRKNHSINNTRPNTSNSQHTDTGTLVDTDMDDRASFESRSLAAYGYNHGFSFGPNGASSSNSGEPIRRDYGRIAYTAEPSKVQEVTTAAEASYGNPFSSGSALHRDAENVVQMFLMSQASTSKTSEPALINPGKIADLPSPTGPYGQYQFEHLDQSTPYPSASDQVDNQQLGHYASTVLATMRKHHFAADEDKLNQDVSKDRAPRTNKYLASDMRWQDTKGKDHMVQVVDTVQVIKVPEMHHAEMVNLRQDESSSSSSESGESNSESTSQATTLTPSVNMSYGMFTNPSSSVQPPQAHVQGVHHHQQPGLQHHGTHQWQPKLQQPIPEASYGLQWDQQQQQQPLVQGHLLQGGLGVYQVKESVPFFGMGSSPMDSGGSSVVGQGSDFRSGRTFDDQAKQNYKAMSPAWTGDGDQSLDTSVNLGEAFNISGSSPSGTGQKKKPKFFSSLFANKKSGSSKGSKQKNTLGDTTSRTPPGQGSEQVEQHFEDSLGADSELEQHRPPYQRADDPHQVPNEYPAGRQSGGNRPVVAQPAGSASTGRDPRGMTTRRPGQYENVSPMVSGYQPPIIPPVSAPVVEDDEENGSEPRKPLLQRKLSMSKPTDLDELMKLQEQEAEEEIGGESGSRQQQLSYTNKGGGGGSGIQVLSPGLPPREPASSGVPIHPATSTLRNIGPPIYQNTQEMFQLPTPQQLQEYHRVEPSQETTEEIDIDEALGFTNEDDDENCASASGVGLQMEPEPFMSSPEFKKVITTAIEQIEWPTGSSALPGGDSTHQTTPLFQAARSKQPELQPMVQEEVGPTLPPLKAPLMIPLATKNKIPKVESPVTTSGSEPAHSMKKQKKKPGSIFGFARIKQAKKKDSAASVPKLPAKEVGDPSETLEENQQKFHPSTDTGSEEDASSFVALPSPLDPPREPLPVQKPVKTDPPHHVSPQEQQQQQPKKSFFKSPRGRKEDAGKSPESPGTDAEGRRQPSQSPPPHSDLDHSYERRSACSRPNSVYGSRESLRSRQRPKGGVKGFFRQPSLKRSGSRQGGGGGGGTREPVDISHLVNPDDSEMVIGQENLPELRQYPRASTHDTSASLLDTTTTSSMTGVTTLSEGLGIPERGGKTVDSMTESSSLNPKSTTTNATTDSEDDLDAHFRQGPKINLNRLNMGELKVRIPTSGNGIDSSFESVIPAELMVSDIGHQPVEDVPNFCAGVKPSDEVPDFSPKRTVEERMLPVEMPPPEELSSADPPHESHLTSRMGSIGGGNFFQGIVKAKKNKAENSSKGEAKGASGLKGLFSNSKKTPMVKQFNQDSLEGEDYVEYDGSLTSTVKVHSTEPKPKLEPFVNPGKKFSGIFSSAKMKSKPGSLFSTPRPLEPGPAVISHPLPQSTVIGLENPGLEDGSDSHSSESSASGEAGKELAADAEAFHEAVDDGQTAEPVATSPGIVQADHQLPVVEDSENVNMQGNGEEEVGEEVTDTAENKEEALEDDYDDTSVSTPTATTEPSRSEPPSRPPSKKSFGIFSLHPRPRHKSGGNRPEQKPSPPDPHFYPPSSSEPHDNGSSEGLTRDKLRRSSKGLLGLVGGSTRSRRQQMSRSTSFPTGRPTEAPPNPPIRQELPMEEPQEFREDRHNRSFTPSTIAHEEDSIEVFENRESANATPIQRDPSRQTGRRSGRFRRQGAQMGSRSTTPVVPIVPVGSKQMSGVDVKSTEQSVLQSLFIDNVKKSSTSRPVSVNTSRRNSMSSSMEQVNMNNYQTDFEQLDRMEESSSSKSRPMRKSTSNLGRTESYRQARERQESGGGSPGASLSNRLMRTGKGRQNMYNSMPRLGGARNKHNQQEANNEEERYEEAVMTDGHRGRPLAKQRSFSRTGSRSIRKGDEQCKLM